MNAKDGPRIYSARHAVKAHDRQDSHRGRVAHPARRRHSLGHQGTEAVLPTTHGAIAQNVSFYYPRLLETSHGDREWGAERERLATVPPGKGRGGGER